MSYNDLFIFTILFIQFLLEMDDPAVDWIRLLALISFGFPILCNSITMLILFAKELRKNKEMKIFAELHQGTMLTMWLLGFISTSNFLLISSRLFGLTMFKAPLRQRSEYLFEAFQFFQLVGVVGSSIAQVAIAIHLQSFHTMAVVALSFNIFFFLTKLGRICLVSLYAQFVSPPVEAVELDIY